MSNKYKKIFIGYSAIVLIILGIFVPKSLLVEPVITPAEYLENIPYWSIGNTILIVPSSTLFIYGLGLFTMFLGVSFLKKKKELSNWWGISMLLWGLGAILAGTSYQGFGYELKCSGQAFCLFTSWFELSYLFATAISIATLAVAIAKSILPEKQQKPLLYYAALSSVIYPIILMIGSIFEIRVLISYELFTIFFMPLFVVFFVYSVIYYKKQKDVLNKTLIITWLLFLVVNISYYIYYFLGITQSLYEAFNIWFSANDVLHILLLLWMIYLWVKVKPLIDKQS